MPTVKQLYDGSVFSAGVETPQLCGQPVDILKGLIHSAWQRYATTGNFLVVPNMPARRWYFAEWETHEAQTIATFPFTPAGKG